MTVLGQLLFVAYLAGFYGRTGVAGRFDEWTRVTPAQFLFPLFVLELYLRAQRGGDSRRIAMAALLAAPTVATIMGTVGATRSMWWPPL